MFYIIIFETPPNIVKLQTFTNNKTYELVLKLFKS